MHAIHPKYLEPRQSLKLLSFVSLFGIWLLVTVGVALAGDSSGQQTMASANRPLHQSNPATTPCAPTALLAEGFEGATLSIFTSTVAACTPGGCGWRPVTPEARSGLYSAFAPNVISVSDQRLSLLSPVSIPSGVVSATLSFWHRHAFDADMGKYYDGSVLELSTNGGATWTDVLSSTNFISGGYTGEIVFGHFNPLQRRRAWGGFNSAYPGFEQVVVDLMPLDGQDLLFRFRLGTDHAVAAQGWWVDDVEVSVSYACPTALLVGHVTWQGRPAQPNVLQQLPVTLTLKLGAVEVNYPIQTTDASGFFTVSVSSLTNGSYAWRGKGPKFLANSGVVPLAGEPMTSLEMGVLLTGDANNDNLVGAVDFNILRGTFGLASGDPNYDDRADFNGDNRVTAVDVSLLRPNFGQGGAPPIGARRPR